MNDPKKVVIGTNTFGIRPMDPFKALEVLGDLQKVILPVIGNLATIIDGKEIAKEVSNDETESKPVKPKDSLDQNIDFSKIGPALTAASNQIDGQTIMKLAKKLITKDFITVEFEDGEQSRMDDAAVMKAFTGNMGEMLQLIWKIVEVNYGDFFTLMPKDFGKALIQKLPKR